MAIGYWGMYIASNKGDLVSENLTPVGFNGLVRSVAFGGQLDGSNAPDVAYFGTGNVPSTLPVSTSGTLYGRLTAGSPLVETNFKSFSSNAAVIAISLDPENARTVYVIDNFSRIWRGSNVLTGTESWSNITGSLPATGRDLR